MRRCVDENGMLANIGRHDNHLNSPSRGSISTARPLASSSDQRFWVFLSRVTLCKSLTTTCMYILYLTMHSELGAMYFISWKWSMPHYITFPPSPNITLSCSHIFQGAKNAFLCSDVTCLNIWGKRKLISLFAWWLALSGRRDVPRGQNELPLLPLISSCHQACGFCSPD